MLPYNKIPKALHELLGKGNVKIRDLETVQQKILTLISGGSSRLQVVTDFDQTITKFHHNGELCDSTYSVLTNSPLLSDEFKLECNLGCKKYGPIEINQSMTIEERIPYMLKWQHEFLQSLIKSKVDQFLIEESIKTSKTYLRDTAQAVLAQLDAAKVPVLIFSAGIEDILIGILRRYNAVYPNLRIVSNKMEFDECDYLIGFRPPSIHSFNKKKGLIEGENGGYFDELTDRSNVVLLGDNIGDINMTDGMSSESDSSTTILKIGFLENQVNVNLDSYMAGYDIVILDDQSWDLFHVMLQYILENKSET